MKNLAILLVVVSSVSVVHSLSCVPCEEARSTCVNVTCSGTVVTDVCGCCPACSKQKGEVCGGPWGISGFCDPNKNLTCYKIVRDGELEFNLDGTCQDEASKKCVFPYVFEECASACQPNCDNLEPQICTLQCVLNRCSCAPGYVRRSATNDTCIQREECEGVRPVECTFPKIWSGCATACPRTCGNPHPRICTKQCDLDPCICPEGYLMRSLTDRRCIKDFECEDFSFCERTCPPLDFSASACELTKSWACALSNWKCTTYQWRMEMEKWWTGCSALGGDSPAVDTYMNLWGNITDCSPRIEIRCQNPENTECYTDAFGCFLCQCTDGKYEDRNQLMSVWIQNYETYKNFMKIYKKAREMCD